MLQLEYEWPARKKVYFAHAWRTFGTPREQEIIDRLHNLDYEVVNPFETKFSIVPYEFYQEHGFYTKEMAEMMVQGDLATIARCDWVLAWLPGVPLLGTIMEIFFAKYVQNMRVDVICDNPSRDHIHPWIQVHATYVFASYENWLAYNPDTYRGYTTKEPVPPSVIAMLEHGDE